jgi:glycosyltransferase involved in cell wall biosynthesis
MTDGLPRNAPTGRRKIRVVHVGHVAQLSGGEIALARLIEALDYVDGHVILAEHGPLVARLRASGVSVEVLPMRERTRDLRKDRLGPGVPLVAFLDTASYVLLLAGRVRAIRPDLVPTNTLKAGVYGSLAARFARVPVVWHVRDRIATDYLKRPAVLLFRALIATLPNGVVVNSEATRATLMGGIEIQQVVCLPVCDPVRAQPAQARRTTRETFVVGMIGRIAPWKGQDLFFKAFAQTFGGGNELAVIVGEAMFGKSETDYAASLRETAEALGIADRVDFRGFREDVWAELERMDILVHASATPEPFGQVIVEAMTAGVPVIATVDGGPQEIVTHDVDGILYPAGDINGLARAVQRLRRDPLLRTQVSANARVRRTFLAGGHRSEHDGAVRARVGAFEFAASMITGLRASTASAERTSNVSATTSECGE